MSCSFILVVTFLNKYKKTSSTIRLLIHWECSKKFSAKNLLSKKRPEAIIIKTQPKVCAVWFNNDLEAFIYFLLASCPQAASMSLPRERRTFTVMSCISKLEI